MTNDGVGEFSGLLNNPPAGGLLTDMKSFVSEPISVLAERLGYRSEAAFCRAFKRIFGVPPGSVRRSMPTG